MFFGSPKFAELSFSSFQATVTLTECTEHLLNMVFVLKAKYTGELCAMLSLDKAKEPEVLPHPVATAQSS